MFRSLSRNLRASGRIQKGRSMSDDKGAREFAIALDKSKKVTVLTGAGISAESGVPTFKEWREWSAMLTTPEAFAANPSMVWEFYHYRRCIVSKAVPNAGHYAITALEKRCEQQGKEFKLLTQNVDGLHSRAGTKSVEELHGSMWKTRCCTCDQVLQNFDMPICAALDGKGCPDPSAYDANIPRLQLPRCRSCNGLLRPHVVWFGESLDLGVMERAHESLRRCDLLLVAGTSAVVQPAAGFIPLVKGGGGAVAEFNLEETPATRYCRYRFQGTCAEALPRSLEISRQELQELELEAAKSAAV